MRRQHNEVTDPKEIKRILSSANIGRLATNGKDSYPYITPVNFVSYNGNIYLHCAPKGEKLDNIKRDPKVCFQVDIPLSYMNMDSYPGRPICQLHQFYHCVIIRGVASIVTENKKKIDVLNKLVAKHERTNDFEQVTDGMPGLKACMVIKNRNRDTAWFSMIDKEWPVFKESIKKWLCTDQGYISLSEITEPIFSRPKKDWEITCASWGTSQHPRCI